MPCARRCRGRARVLTKQQPQRVYSVFVAVTAAVVVTNDSSVHVLLVCVHTAVCKQWERACVRGMCVLSACICNSRGARETTLCVCEVFVALSANHRERACVRSYYQHVCAVCVCVCNGTAVNEVASTTSVCVCPSCAYYVLSKIGGLLPPAHTCCNR